MAAKNAVKALSMAPSLISAAAARGLPNVHGVSFDLVGALEWPLRLAEGAPGTRVRATLSN